MADTKYWNT